MSRVYTLAHRSWHAWKCHSASQILACDIQIVYKRQSRGNICLRLRAATWLPEDWHTKEAMHWHGLTYAELTVFWTAVQVQIFSLQSRAVSHIEASGICSPMDWDERGVGCDLRIGSLSTWRTPCHALYLGKPLGNTTISGKEKNTVR